MVHSLQIKSFIVRCDMRQLTYKAVQLMDGCKVIVHDGEYDEYDQECEVKVFKDITPHPFKKRKMIEYVKRVILFNEEFLFEYDQRGNCLNGDFQVFTK